MRARCVARLRARGRLLRRHWNTGTMESCGSLVGLVGRKPRRRNVATRARNPGACDPHQRPAPLHLRSKCRLQKPPATTGFAGVSASVTPAKAGVQRGRKVTEMGRTRTGFLAGPGPFCIGPKQSHPATTGLRGWSWLEGIPSCTGQASRRPRRRCALASPFDRLLGMLFQRLRRWKSKSAKAVGAATSFAQDGLYAGPTIKGARWVLIRASKPRVRGRQETRSLGDARGWRL